MFRSKRQQEILESTESKLAKMFEEMNTEKRLDNGRTVCETECTCFGIAVILLNITELSQTLKQSMAILSCARVFLQTEDSIVPGG